MTNTKAFIVGASATIVRNGKRISVELDEKTLDDLRNGIKTKKMPDLIDLATPKTESVKWRRRTLIEL